MPAWAAPIRENPCKPRLFSPMLRTVLASAASLALADMARKGPLTDAEALASANYFPPESYCCPLGEAAHGYCYRKALM